MYLYALAAIMALIADRDDTEEVLVQAALSRVFGLLALAATVERTWTIHSPKILFCSLAGILT